MSSITTRINTLPRETRLSLALKLDAVVTSVNAAAYLIAAGPLGELFGVDAALLRGIGAFLLAFAAVVWIVGSREGIARPAVTAVIEANVLWVIGSLVFVVAGVSSPEAAGSVWTVLQAGVVAGFAWLQARSR